MDVLKLTENAAQAVWEAFLLRGVFLGLRLGGRIPLEVNGKGLLDCMLYRQPGRIVLPNVNSGSVRLLVTGSSGRVSVREGWATFTAPKIEEHEVAVFTT